MTGKAGAALVGAEQLNRALKLAIPHVAANMRAAIEKNTKAIASAAKARAPHLTGELANTIRDEYSQDGFAGFVKVGKGKLPRRSRAVTAKGQTRAKGRQRKTGQGAYAPVVERGDPRRHHKPHPFLIPSFTARKPTAMADISHALNDGVSKI